MSDETRDNKDWDLSDSFIEKEDSDYQPLEHFDASATHHLTGMYQSWFLDYASYVILERAVPSIQDGLKPVQRRILHSMKRMDDGRYNKVANIVGHTMQFHPHGDASIGDALVQLGQKDLLVETQGNWGNILTGDRAAAPRYIEARLSSFALETLFNDKTTDWQKSYDGRNLEPVTLPAKFPLLLEQGADGIAVGLSSKILPHNFNEICDVAIRYLRGEEFTLYPDFPTGGSIDVSKYNDGKRGGQIKVRAKIEKRDSKTLAITEIPYGKTTTTLIDSILKAIEKGKIKVRKVDDNTSAQAEILIHLASGVSSDKTIDALYAFTDCEVNIAPNCCVIDQDKPQFLSVSQVLRRSVDNTMELLRRELQIKREELAEQLLFCSLEKIFIEERVYKDKEFEEAKDIDEACRHIDKRLSPFYPQMVRQVTRNDVLKLLEIKMQRILKFSKDKSDALLARINKDIKATDKDLARIVDVTIKWFSLLKDKYGSQRARRTEIRNFETIQATQVVEANEKLYINRQEGFIGTGLKKDEFICNCSDIDDVIIFFRSGKYKILRVAEKIYIGKNAIYVAVLKKNDKRTTYNVVYRDGQTGPYFIKRFFVTGINRDREYDLTQGKMGSKVMYFTANANGEAEKIKVSLDPNSLESSRANAVIERDFSQIMIKGRATIGNILTRKKVLKISLKSHGHSTLGDRKVWFDPDINRLNYDGHGKFLGEFNDSDRILVVLQNGEYYTTDFETNNHYEDNILLIEKYESEKIWTAAVIDFDNGGNLYLKRFMIEAYQRHRNYIGDNKDNKKMLLTDTPYPRILVTFSEKDATGVVYPPMEIDAEQFISVRGSKAKGRKVAKWQVEKVEELEPIRVQQESESNNKPNREIGISVEEEEDKLSKREINEDDTGQLSLF